MRADMDEFIPRGVDFLTTICAQQRIVIPADFMGVMKEPFDEMVAFIGAPLNPPHGNADTVMERLEDGAIGKPVSTRLAAFLNVSAAPVRIPVNGDDAKYFDIYVTLSPKDPSPGETIFYSDDGISGEFESEISLSPLFELRPLGGAESIFIDTGTTPIPGFPMRLGSTGGRWSRRPSMDNAVRSFGGTSLYYTSEVMIRATDQEAKPLAACAKRQAEFKTNSGPLRYERMRFGTPKSFTNIEIDRWT